ncbi:E3 ubiquitin-protein ligase SH3RF3 [Callorhinchus milii]|uniref:E3 ubiquitin-protein ligase SH3RF3 n=1 Tax=Callorhinchus milii TaxID=7868 RepID=UPI0004572E4C|nr:E3 ubiquitin-protein ligase SH3RF3 [Callorhinchus milii]|eukprot:gi/632972352/ref/XP_007902615.1/ PREDICTED: SH3 domain-containing RING finger protein 3 [Callorhinchus milii]
MDESSLLDLLECSVCLERLDTTAKVLPCQHTFCKRCLEKILSSRNELRCPECRILVGCGVDELPPNILLVRLLDGIKQRPRNGSRSGPICAPGSAAACPASSSSSSPSSSSSSPSSSLGTTLKDHPAAATRASPGKSIPQLPCAKALYNYEGKEPGDLKFCKGDIIILRRKVDENWYHGELNGTHGFFPATYIQCIKPLPQPPPQGKALYDFEVKDKEQDKDCLTFTKDEILTVIRRVDDNWAEGMLGDKIGIFPILYVELNPTAKHLIEMDKPCLPVAQSSDGTPTAGSSAGAGPAISSPLNSVGAISAVHRRIDGKKNAKKRHSFTSFSISHKASQAVNNRHSMEISAPVLISSSDPRAVARIGEGPHLSSSAPSQDSSSIIASTTVGAVGPRLGITLGDQGVATKAQLPLNIYMALYAYKPQKTDELELRKGEMYRVIEKCQDGWFKGTSLRNGTLGVFPGNYVTPVSRAPFGVAQSRNAVLGGAVQTVKGNSTSGHSAVIGLVNNGVKPVPPVVIPPAQPQLHTASPQINNCLRYSGQQTVNQARSAMQMVHPAVQVLDRPTATVPPLRTQSPPSRVPATMVRPQPMTSPQHIHQCNVSGTSGVPGCRPAISLTSAAVAITPPNVNAANLNGDAMGGPASTSVTSSPSNSAPALAKLEERKSEKKEKKSSLLKLLSGASAKKKSRSPPSVSPTHDSQQAAAAATAGSSLQGAVGPEILPVSSHGRAGSCPLESEMQGAMGMEPLHRKTGSLDSNFSISPPTRQICSSMAAVRPELKPLPCERYRVVVPYPPQSEAEIELKEGDVVFVHKKREDGWFKGTLQRNGKTGLFPGSFVESF